MSKDYASVEIRFIKKDYYSNEYILESIDRTKTFNSNDNFSNYLSLFTVDSGEIGNIFYENISEAIMLANQKRVATNVTQEEIVPSQAQLATFKVKEKGLNTEPEPANQKRVATNMTQKDIMPNAEQLEKFEVLEKELKTETEQSPLALRYPVEYDESTTASSTPFGSQSSSITSNESTPKTLEFNTPPSSPTSSPVGQEQPLSTDKSNGNYQPPNSVNPNLYIAVKDLFANQTTQQILQQIQQQTKQYSLNTGGKKNIYSKKNMKSYKKHVTFKHM
jgi:hypothetical protein